MHKVILAVNPVFGTLQSLGTLLLNSCSYSDIGNNIFLTPRVFVSVSRTFYAFIELNFVQKCQKLNSRE